MPSNVQKAHVRSALLACAVLAASAAAGEVGCSSVSSAPSGAPSNQGVISAAISPPDNAGVGTADVTVTWTVPAPGEQLATLSWTITQPGDAGTVSGNVDGSSGSPVSFVVNNLPEDPGHTTDTITVSGETTDGFTSCSGSSSFAINPNKQTAVSVTLQCNPVVPDSGYAQVNGSTYECATLTAASAIPSEVTVGHSLALSATALFPDPALGTYAWSAPSGTFSASKSANPSFTCTATGIVPVTIKVADGSTPSATSCNSVRNTTTLSITCD